MRSMWYRVPLTEDGHLISNDPNLFYCGRSVRLPDEWWNQYAQPAWGDQYLIADTREGNKCAGCKRKDIEAAQLAKWDQELTIRTLPTDSPITQQEYEERFKPEWEAAEKQFHMLAQWVASELNGVIIDGEE